MPVFGDAEAAVVDILEADSGVGVYAPHITTDLVGYGTGDRWLRVTRTGGRPTLWMRLDNPLIAVAAYGEDKATALDLAVAARGALFAARGVYSGHGLALYDVGDDDGLTWSPDELNPGAPRYTFSLSLVTRPA